MPIWLAFNGSRNVSLHLNGFQPYKVILTYQASKKTDFTVDPIWWGSPQLAIIVTILKSCSILYIALLKIAGLLFVTVIKKPYKGLCFINTYNQWW